LAPRGVRHGRLRLLPLAHDAGGRVGDAHPLRRRANPGRRSRARPRLASLRRAHRAHVTVELGALAELEPALRADGFFGSADRVARVYIGYRATDALRRSGLAAPPEPC